MTTQIEKSTKAGVKAALNSLGYFTEMPEALKTVKAAADFTADEKAFAKYLIYDTDFGGAWNDAAQINMHLA